ncbi:hypothetical protein [Candidatus Dactylopiibacterium carminicum]|uniref:hypothetical protein n=1 Tax=Candidatus Dactylopiibacterium carminicum TaxID=857335 RepID=UPI001CC29022|nr:hypothetical protein [Candidatus Dactylopiibacterium carminicum]
MIERDIRDEARWVLSGSLCSWGGPLLPYFTLAVFLSLDPAVRMARIAAREQTRYGDRLEPGGDMRQQHLEFMAWASSYDHARAPVRSFDLHERWMTTLHCPVIRLDSAEPVEHLCDAVLRQMAT